MAEPSIETMGKIGLLPAELRIMIYGEVFGRTKVITPKRSFSTALSGDQLLQPEVYTKTPVHTCILLTNRKIRGEALDVLYKDRIVRGSISELNTLLHNAEFRDLVERIEIDDCFSTFQTDSFAHDLLLETGKLPKIRSTTILSDKFAFTQHGVRSYVTVRDFAMIMYLGEAICVDIGRYQLRSSYFSHVQIVHRKLVEMWPNVASTPEDYDVCADVLGLDSGNDRCILTMFNGVAWAAQTSLRRWVGLYNEFLHIRLNPFSMDRTDEQQALLNRFVLSTRKLQHLHHGSIPSYEEYVNQSRVCNRLMSTLRPSDDPEMLAWATDILSVNIAAFIPLRGRDPQTFLQRAHWAETDGGLHTLDIMKMHFLSARRGDVDAIFLSHPVLPEIYEYTAAVQSVLTGYPRQILRCKVHDLNPRRIRQFYLLLIAMNRGQYFNPGQQQLVDNWSLRLFQRYLLTDPSVCVDEASTATLDDLRRIMGFMIRSFQLNNGNFLELAALLKRTNEPADELDPDIVPALA